MLIRHVIHAGMYAAFGGSRLEPRAPFSVACCSRYSLRSENHRVTLNIQVANFAQDHLVCIFRRVCGISIAGFDDLFTSCGASTCRKGSLNRCLSLNISLCGEMKFLGDTAVEKRTPFQDTCVALAIALPRLCAEIPLLTCMGHLLYAHAFTKRKFSKTILVFCFGFLECLHFIHNAFLFDLV